MNGDHSYSVHHNCVIHVPMFELIICLLYCQQQGDATKNDAYTFSVQPVNFDVNPFCETKV